MGAKKVAAVGYGISPSSSESAKATETYGAKAQGLKGVYLNNTVDFGTTDVTPLVLGDQELGGRRPLPAARLRHQLRHRAEPAAERREDEGQHPRHRLQPGPARPAHRRHHHAQRRHVHRVPPGGARRQGGQAVPGRPQEVRRPHRRARLRDLHRVHHLRHGHRGTQGRREGPDSARASSTASAASASSTVPASPAHPST